MTFQRSAVLGGKHEHSEDKHKLSHCIKNRVKIVNNILHYLCFTVAFNYSTEHDF